MLTRILKDGAIVLSVQTPNFLDINVTTKCMGVTVSVESTHEIQTLQFNSQNFFTLSFSRINTSLDIYVEN